MTACTTKEPKASDQGKEEKERERGGLDGN